MSRILSWITLTLLALSPATALADHHEPDENKAGGNAAEHRNDKANAHSNAQWSDGAMKGQERANDVNEEAKEKADAAERARNKAATKGDRYVPPKTKVQKPGGTVAP